MICFNQNLENPKTRKEHIYKNIRLTLKQQLQLYPGWLSDNAQAIVNTHGEGTDDPRHGLLWNICFQVNPTIRSESKHSIANTFCSSYKKETPPCLSLT